jgi:predicted N-acetyltransferase YhbS
MSNECNCYVAEIDGELVGCGAWFGRPVRSRFETRRVATVRSIYVNPDFTGRGVARRMMAQVEADIAAAGYSDITLEATLIGAPFYGRMGYREKRSMSLKLPGGMLFGCVTMSKHLVGPAASGAALQSAA